MSSAPSWLVEALKASQDPEAIWRAFLYHSYNTKAYERWPFTDQPGAQEVRVRMWESPTIRDWSFTLNEQAEILKRFPELKGLEIESRRAPRESERQEGQGVG